MLMLFQDSLFADDREKHRRSREYGTPEFRQAYLKYIASAQWKKLCAAVKDRAKGRCEGCRKPSPRLEIHHLTYERFQQERLTDLRALCNPCHVEADRQRELQNQRQFEAAGEEAQYYTARETYFTKKYGESWDLLYDHGAEQMEDEFQSWLERKQEQQYDDY